MFRSFLVSLTFAVDAVNIPFHTVQLPHYRENSRLGKLLAQCGDHDCGRLESLWDVIYVSDISVGGKCEYIGLVIGGKSELTRR
jgi:hypothetical protein